MNRALEAAIVGGFLFALWIAWHGGWLVFLAVFSAIAGGMALGWYLAERQDRRYRGY